MHLRTCADVASQLSLSVSIFNTTVKNHEVTEISYIWCSPFSKQQKSIKHLLLEELEPAVAAQFKQGSVSNVLAHCTISQQSPHTLQLVSVLTTSWVSTNRKADLREDIPPFTAGVVIRKEWMTEKMAVRCNKLKSMTSITHKKLMKQVCFTVKPVRSLTFFWRLLPIGENTGYNIFCTQC